MSNRRVVKRLGSLIVTMLLIVATNLAISYTENTPTASKTGMSYPNPPRPKTGMSYPNPPRPKTGMSYPNPPRPKTGMSYPNPPRP